MKIVKSKDEPSNREVLWVDANTNTIKAFTSNGWTQISAVGGQETPNGESSEPTNIIDVYLELDSTPGDKNFAPSYTINDKPCTAEDVLNCIVTGDYTIYINMEMDGITARTSPTVWKLSGDEELTVDNIVFHADLASFVYFTSRCSLAFDLNGNGCFDYYIVQTKRATDAVVGNYSDLVGYSVISVQLDYDIIFSSGGVEAGGTVTYLFKNITSSNKTITLTGYSHRNVDVLTIPPGETAEVNVLSDGDNLHVRAILEKS